MNYLHALPVHGDSFLLQRTLKNSDLVNILVDGGGSQKIIQALNQLKVKKVDIAVCTHSDHDHINGLSWLVESKSISLTELWVPGEWFDITTQLEKNPKDFYRNLIDEILKDEGIDVEVAYPIISTIDELVATSSVDGESLSTIIYEKIVNLALIIKKTSKALIKKITDALKFYCMTIDRIRSLVTKALKANVRIRWFQFDENKRSGGEDYLKPVNCVEVAKVSASSTGSFNLLTIQNKCALVFHSPFNSGKDIIFSSDSNFDFDFNSYNLVSKKLAFTAPHHGSKNNSNAYYCLKNISNIDTVCLKCRTSSVSIGTEFLNVANKHCNCCNRGAKNYQRVTFDISKWTFLNKPRACICVSGK
ncbi:MBL fold metallo-hydrolase [Vibrio owensii]|uniref:MBL fold metallo-hydrolase n=1 Tax=Vibrio owensii TaxID=696485 RepID=UPI00221F332E|nr:MBL fold metallo-hydrolase [Vibrio owensii]